MHVQERLLDIQSFATPYRASLLVLASQAVAAILHGLAKTIETATVPIHPLQILLVRLLVTVTFCSWYLWHRSSPALEPAEARIVQPLLVIRAMGGCLSAVGFYYSISYLPLSIATSINFLAPFCASIAIRALGKDSFNRVEIICSVTALIGVVLIVQSESFLGHSLVLRNAKETMNLPPVGLAFAFLAVLGGTVAYTAIQKIGKRAHPLLSVNYFGIAVIIVSITSSMTIPSVKFTWDIEAQNWAILFLIGVCGASMEWLLTAGLSDATSSCATQMIYSQVLWALALDTIVWKETINMVALMGIGVVVASILTVSLLVKKANERGTYEPVMADDSSGYDIEVAEIIGGMDL